MPKGKIDIEAYPSIRDWLLPHKPDLERRATKQEWFELQQAQLVYQPKFESPKIIYGHFASGRTFALDLDGYFSNDKSYFIPGAPTELLAQLNSQLTWFFVTGISPAVRGGFHEMRVQYLERVPIPSMDDATRTRLAELGGSCSDAGKERLCISAAVERRLHDLVPLGRALTRNLERWWELDFPAFRAAFTRAYRIDIPVKERDEWEAYLAENALEVRALSTKIENAEHEIDAIVYRLFELTPDEIRLLEESIEAAR